MILRYFDYMFLSIYHCLFELIKLIYLKKRPKIKYLKVYKVYLKIYILKIICLMFFQRRESQVELFSTLFLFIRKLSKMSTKNSTKIWAGLNSREKLKNCSNFLRIQTFVDVLMSWNVMIGWSPVIEDGRFSLVY